MTNEHVYIGAWTCAIRLTNHQSRHMERNIIGSQPSDHYFRSFCWFVCLFVCLCRVFLSRLWSDFDQTRTYVICQGL